MRARRRKDRGEASIDCRTGLPQQRHRRDFHRAEELPRPGEPGQKQCLFLNTADRREMRHGADRAAPLPAGTRAPYASIAKAPGRVKRFEGARVAGVARGHHNDARQAAKASAAVARLCCVRRSAGMAPDRKQRSIADRIALRAARHQRLGKPDRRSAKPQDRWSMPSRSSHKLVAPWRTG